MDTNRLLKLFAQYNMHEVLKWTANNVVKFYVSSSNLFAQGSTDWTYIESDKDIGLLEKCFSDCIDNATDDYRLLSYVFAPSLYCCRKRKLAPQSTRYENTPKPLRFLFSEFPDLNGGSYDGN